MLQSHSNFQRLRKVVVGRSYPPEFYSWIPSTSVRKIMEKIAEQTEADFQKLIELLESLDVEVYRPDLSTVESMDPSTGKFYKPPMYPRDDMLLLDGKFFVFHARTNDPYDHIIDMVRSQGNPIFDCRDPGLEYLRTLSAPCIVKGGPSVLLDQFSDDLSLTKEQINQAIDQFTHDFLGRYTTHKIDTGGHSDGTFCIVAPGLIISTQGAPSLGPDFADWEIVEIPGRTWEADSIAKQYKQLQEQNGRRFNFWIPGQDYDPEVVDFIDNGLSHWLGNVEESVFDVNMLVIDEHTVICNQPNPLMDATFQQWGITAHYCDLKTSVFWDGGLNCVTLDLHRS